MVVVLDQIQEEPALIQVQGMVVVLDQTQEELAQILVQDMVVALDQTQEELAQEIEIQNLIQEKDLEVIKEDIRNT